MQVETLASVISGLENEGKQASSTALTCVTCDFEAMFSAVALHQFSVSFHAVYWFLDVGRTSLLV